MKSYGGWSRPVKKNRRNYKLAAAAADIAVSKVAQKRRRSSGVSSVSVFQAPAKAMPEKKSLDVTSTLTPTGAAPTGLQLLNGVGPGTDINQHIGRTVTLKSLYWIWQGNVAATTAGGSAYRLLIVYDKESEGAAPTIATGAKSDILATNAIYGMNNLDNRDRFVTLVDEMVECIGTGGPQSFLRKGYRKISMPMVFNSTGDATVNSIQTGGVWAFAFQGGTAITAAPVTTLQTRLRFVDN